MKKQHTADVDDDAPLSAGELRKLKRVSDAKRVRMGLGLSQSEFSARFGIPLGTLRDWEQLKSKPDRASRTLLAAIKLYPEQVAKAAKRVA